MTKKTRNTNTSQTVRAIIAHECDIPVKSIKNSTPFMANKNLSFFVCADALFELEHRCHIQLPEEAFDKFKTVGGLTRYIISHSNIK